MTMLMTLPEAIPVEHPGVGHWIHLVQAEYREMPCLSLTRAQMQRLWGLDSDACDALIDALVGARFLRRTPTGTYVAVASAR